MTGFAFLPPQLQVVVPPELAGRDMRLAWRTVRPDLTSRDGFVWPLPGGCARIDPGAVDRSSAECGAGLHVATTVAGGTAAQLGRTVLLCAVDPTEVEWRDGKGRTHEVWVLAVGDLHWAVGPGADLTRANLTRADADKWTRWPAGFDPTARGVTVR